MKRLSHLASVILTGISMLLLNPAANSQAFWSQWGRNPQHTGMVDVAGQMLNNKIADIVYDPFSIRKAADPASTAHDESPSSLAPA
jgi:hypothetical protein